LIGYVLKKTICRSMIVEGIHGSTTSSVETVYCRFTGVTQTTTQAMGIGFEEDVAGIVPPAVFAKQKGISARTEGNAAYKLRKLFVIYLVRT
jgi:hypothetical protein